MNQRIIEFRGKSKKTGQWIYGDLIQTLPYKDGHIHCWIKEKSILGIPVLSISAEDFIEVVSKTVGQFTNIHDKNGKKIYEEGCNSA